jgi:PAS domain S-box-containing protein
MKSLNLMQRVQPFIAAAAVLITAGILVFAIYFTLLDLEWIAFLAGTLFAAVLAVVSRATRAEAAAAHRGKRLAVTEDRLNQEIERREKAELMLGRANARLHFAADVMPLMAAYVDAEGIYRFHNQAYGRWLDLPPHRIDGHHIREVLGRNVYAQVESEVTRAFAGELVRTERTQKMANGSVYRIAVQYMPIADGQGKVGGFYVLLTDLTERHDLQASGAVSVPGSVPAEVREANAAASQAQFVESIAQEVTGMTNARERILAAIERNEFTLFCQLITPLNAGNDTCHHEVLIRLLEEENNMIPPGAFFPLAEESGLLPQLDRWVVSNLLKWLATHERYRKGMGREAFFVNVATATLGDPDFPDYVAQQLHRYNLDGGLLCFEIADSDLMSNRGDAEDFARSLKKAGCRLALSGFGRDRVSVEVLKNLPLDFIKIDGSLILQILKDSVGLGKVVALSRVARGIGIATIAEMVEDDATATRLREITVDYAQGFGISRPSPLSELV